MSLGLKPVSVLVAVALVPLGASAWTSLSLHQRASEEQLADLHARLAESTVRFIAVSLPVRSPMRKPRISAEGSTFAILLPPAARAAQPETAAARAPAEPARAAPPSGRREDPSGGTPDIVDPKTAWSSVAWSSVLARASRS
jgi:hypothetical protein